MLFLHIFQQFKSSLPTLERFQRRYHPLTVLALLVETFFAWAVCCPITDHVIFSREYITWPVMGKQTAKARKLCYKLKENENRE